MPKSPASPAGQAVAALQKKQAAQARSAFRAEDAKAAFRAGTLGMVAMLYHAPRAATKRVRARRSRTGKAFGSEVAQDDYFTRASNAACAAVPGYTSWLRKARRRNSWGAFERYIFLAVDRELKKPQMGQGANTDHDEHHLGLAAHLRNPPRVLDISGSPGTADMLPERASRETLEAFKAQCQRTEGNTDDYDLATAVEPYSSVTLRTYVQTSRPRGRYTDNDREILEARIWDARVRLYLFNLQHKSVAIPSMLDFGAFPPIWDGWRLLKLPGRPPTGPELFGPRWDDLATHGQEGLVKGAQPLTGQLGRLNQGQDDGLLQPLAQRYMVALGRWWASGPWLERMVAAQAAAMPSAPPADGLTPRQRHVENSRDVLAAMKEWAGAGSDLPRQIAQEREAADKRTISEARKSLKRKASKRSAAR